MKSWLVLVPIAGSLVTAAGARAQVIEREPEPENWLAFVSHTAGWARTRRWVTASTPEITLHRDGRVVWVDHGATGDGFWKIGRVTPVQLMKVRSLIKRSLFLELPVDPPREKRQQIFDAGGIYVGCSDGARSRTIGVDAPTMFGGASSASFLVRGAIEIEKALRVLLPAKHQPYRPSSIRVGLMHAKETTNLAVELPVDQPPIPLNSTGGPYNYYSGEVASKVIEALNRNRFVRVGETVYEAVWSPAIVSPKSGLRGYANGEPTIPVVPSKVERLLRWHLDAVTCVQWSPDGKRMVTASPSNEDPPRIWDALAGKQEREFNSQGPNYSVSWSPDGSRLLFGATFGLLLDLQGTIKGPAFENKTWSVNAVAWNRDGKYLALGAPIQVVEVSSRKQIWKTEYRNASGLAFLPKLNQLVSASPSGAIELRNGSDGTIILSYRNGFRTNDHFGLHFPLALHPNGKQLAVPGLSDGTVRRWNVETGAEATPLRLEGPTPNSLAWSRNGRALAATAGLTLWIWDTKTGKRRTIQSPSELYSATWSPDGRRIAAGCADGSVRIWRVEAAKPG